MERDLVQAPIFQNLPKHELKQIALVCELRRFCKGENIFQEGQPAECVWVVKRGWVYLVKRTPQGRAFVYQPCVDREKTLGQMVKDLLGRAFEGSASDLVAHVLDASNPTTDELDAIRQTIEEYHQREDL